MILQVNDHPHPANQVNQLLNNQHDNQTNSSVAHCPDSLARWYCLNGATCFRVLVEESILYNCLCQQGFHGARCDFKYTGGAASSVARSNSTAEDETADRLESMGASSDRMAALGLSGDDLLLSSHIRNMTTSGQQQNTQSLIDQVDPTVLAPVFCLIIILVIAMCALLAKKFFKEQSLEQRARQRQAGRVSRAISDRLTLDRVKTGDRSVSGYRVPASCEAERQVAGEQQQVAYKWDDTLRVERNYQSDYFCKHAIELARQATNLDTCEWEQRPAVAATAAIHQTAGVSLSRSHPL